MKLETFFKKFEQFAETPNAVTKMRELILDLAIGGKLLPTSHKDEHSVDCDWPNQPLGSIASLITKGSTPTSYGYKYETSGIPFVKVENIKDGAIQRSSAGQFISEATHEFLKRSQLEDGDILFSIAGTIGKTCIVTAQDVPANTNQALAIIRGVSASFEISFLKMQLDSFVANKVKAKARGGAMPNVSLGDLRDLHVVVPSLAEQKRIVAKVGELMALCDRLETQQQERDARHASLVCASLNRFANAPTPANLIHIFHPSYAIDPADIRKTILNLAVQGKLVPQDVNDKPAESLNDKILLSLKTIAKRVGARFTKPSALIESRDDLPAGWGVAPLQSVGITQTGTTPSKSEPSFEGNHIPFIKPGDIKGDVIDYENEGLSIDGLRAGRLIPLDSILMVSIGGSIGKTALVDRDVSCNQQINSVTPAECIAPRFILAAIRSQDFQNEVINRAAQCTLPIISKSKWETIRVPIPPLAEQRRIVAKVDQLMTLVDQLETQLAASRTAAVNLMEAVVAELTAQE